MPTDKKTETKPKEDKELELLKKKLGQAERDKTKLERECQLHQEKEKKFLDEVTRLQGELVKLGKSVTLTKEDKKSLSELCDFMFSLYKESEHVGVRKNLKSWRELVSKLT